MLENTAEKISPILIENNRKRRVIVKIWDHPMTLKEILQNCDDDFNIECCLETNIKRLRAGDDCLSKDLFGSDRFDFTECHIEGYPGGTYHSR